MAVGFGALGVAGVVFGGQVAMGYQRAENIDEKSMEKPRRINEKIDEKSMKIR